MTTYDATGCSAEVSAWLRGKGIDPERATTEQIAEALNATGALGGRVTVEGPGRLTRERVEANLRKGAEARLALERDIAVLRGQAPAKPDHPAVGQRWRFNGVTRASVWRVVAVPQTAADSVVLRDVEPGGPKRSVSWNRLRTAYDYLGTPPVQRST